MKYKLLKGSEADISKLPKEDIDFILGLYAQAMNNEDYFDLMRTICGPGAYPLKGSPGVTREIHDSTLYLVAEDIVDRVGMRQGAILPDEDDVMVPTQMIVSAQEAAKKLGVTRSAVIKAAQQGKIKGKKIGGTWALLLESVEAYKVAPHRVAAGRAAHRQAKIQA